MLQKNVYAEGLLRTLTALVGRNAVVRLVDGLICPRCQARLHNDAEQTEDGWRLLCRKCHVDILTVEGECHSDIPTVDSDAS
jgi:ribosomal protein L40E